MPAVVREWALRSPRCLSHSPFPEGEGKLNAFTFTVSSAERVTGGRANQRDWEWGSDEFSFRCLWSVIQFRGAWDRQVDALKAAVFYGSVAVWREWGWRDGLPCHMHRSCEPCTHCPCRRLVRERAEGG